MKIDQLTTLNRRQCIRKHQLKASSEYSAGVLSRNSSSFRIDVGHKVRLFWSVIMCWSARVLYKRIYTSWRYLQHERCHIEIETPRYLPKRWSIAVLSPTRLKIYGNGREDNMFVGRDECMAAAINVLNTSLTKKKYKLIKAFISCIKKQRSMCNPIYGNLLFRRNHWND